MKVPFSIRSLAAIAAPATGRIYVRDERQPGLQLCITDRNVRTFYLVKKVNGKPQRYRLGRLGELTVEQARDQAARKIVDIANGLNPMEQRRKAREQPTVADLIHHWIEQHAKPKKKTWAEDERLTKKHLEGWKPRQLTTISRADVAALHSRLGSDHGKYLANRVLALLSSMFGKAHEIGHEGINPTSGVQKFRESSRDRYLTTDELPSFFTALKAHPDHTLRDFFLIALLTGARRGNVQAMRWEDIDLLGGRWRIPETKSGESVQVHLSEASLAVLVARKEFANDSPWVFPGHKKGMHIKEPKAAWKSICEKAGIEDLRIHDLRRTLGSWQAMLGTSLPIIAKSLGHKTTSATTIYARLGIEPVAESVNRATAAILEASQQEFPAMQSVPDAITNASKPNGKLTIERR